MHVVLYFMQVEERGQQNSEVEGLPVFSVSGIDIESIQVANYKYFRSIKICNWTYKSHENQRTHDVLFLKQQMPALVVSF